MTPSVISIAHTSGAAAWKQRGIAALVVLGSVALAVAYYYAPHKPQPPPNDYMRMTADLWHAPFFDAVPQSSAYRVFLLSLGAMSAAGIALLLLLSRKGQSLGSIPLAARASTTMLRLSPWLAGLLFLYPVWSETTTTMGAGGRELAWTVEKSAAVVLFLGIFIRLLKPSWLKVLLWIILVAYCALLLVPGFLAPLSLETPLWLKWVDWHFDAVMGTAKQMRDGLDAFSVVRPPYGITWPGLLGMAEMGLGRLDFEWHVRLVQATQAAFIVLAVVSFRLWLSRSVLFALVGVLVFGAYAGTTHHAIVFPNQSGWRFLGIPLAVLMLAATRNLAPGTRALLLGVVAGFLNLQAPELSIVVTLGYLAFLVVSTGGAPLRFRLPKKEMLFFAGIALAWAAYFLLHRIVYGDFPSRAGRLFDTIFRVTGSGFSGAAFYLDPAFVVIAALAAYRCSSLFIKSVTRGVTHREASVFAISIISLIWLAYFMNRASHWNLWVQIYLMMFLLPRSLFFPPARRLGAPLHLLRLSMGAISLRVTRATWFYALFLAPLAFSLNMEYFKVRALMLPDPQAGPPLSERPKAGGMLVAPLAADLIRQRTAFLHANDRQGIHVVTKLPFMMRVLGGSSSTWVVNPFIQYNEETFPEYIRILLKKSPRLILFDTEADGIAADDANTEQNWQALCNLVRAGISRKYKKTGTREGWEVWEKKGTGTPEPAGG